MIKKRAHIASTILGLEYEEEESRKVCYLNADAKDKIDFRAYVAQIRDFLLGNVDYFFYFFDDYDRREHRRR